MKCVKVMNDFSCVETMFIFLRDVVEDMNQRLCKTPHNSRMELSNHFKLNN